MSQQNLQYPSDCFDPARKTVTGYLKTIQTWPGVS